MTALLLATLVNQLVPDRQVGGRRRDVNTVPLVCDAQMTMHVPVSVEGSTGAPVPARHRREPDDNRRGHGHAARTRRAGRIPSPTGSDPLVTARLTVGRVRARRRPRRDRGLPALSELFSAKSDGILGSDALRAMRRVTIDYERCILLAGETIGPRRRRAVRVPLECHEGRPVVVIGGGGRLRARLGRRERDDLQRHAARRRPCAGAARRRRRSASIDSMASAPDCSAGSPA